MGLQKFDVEFDNPHKIYYAGQRITGRVIIHTTKEKRIRGVFLRLKGEAEVRFTETRTETENGKEYTVTDHYCANEIYVQMESWLVGSSYEDMLLPSGEHIYPFSYVLPQNIPFSFEGMHGHVRYIVKVKIDRPWRFDHDCKVAFTVLTPLDLNFEDNMQEPTQVTKEKFLCCWCCRSGPITVVTNVSRGFVPGQNIAAIIECDNMTNEEVSIKCELQKKVSFQGYCNGSAEKVYDEDVVDLERLGSVGAHGSNTWTTNLTVPSLPASYLKYCNCIDISYQFVVKGKISGPHAGIYIGIPIVIGTIPLKTYFPSIIPSAPVLPVAPTPSSNMSPFFNKAMEIPSAPPMAAENPYPDIPPPTYEECMFAKGNIRNNDDSDHVYGAMDFAPRYPMYSFH